MKKCPFCAEEIQDEAIKCKHCGEMLGTPKQFTTIKKGSCPICHKVYDDSWKVCFDCGIPLTTKEEKVEVGHNIGGSLGNTSVIPTNTVKAESSVMSGVKLGVGMFIVLPILIIGILLFIFLVLPLLLTQFPNLPTLLPLIVVIAVIIFLISLFQKK